MKSIKKTITLLTISVIVTIAATVSVTYAYLSSSANQTTANNLSTINCFDLTFTEQTSSISRLGYPMTSEKGLATSPYTFNVKNTCANSSYLILLNVKNATDAELLPYIYYSIDGVTVNRLSNSVTLPAGVTSNDTSATYLLGYDTLETTNTSGNTYQARFWIDESADNSIMGKSFQGEIMIYNMLDALDVKYPPKFTVTTTSGVDSITVTATPTEDSSAIAKYYYSIDGGATYQESVNNTYTFQNLEQNKEYRLRVYAKSTDNVESGVQTIPTKIKTPNIMLAAVEAGTSITVTATPAEDSSALTTYYFSIDGGTTYQESATNSYTFTGLTVDETYSIKAYAKDANNLVSEVKVTSIKTNLPVGSVEPFSYQNSQQTYTILANGYYKLQVWGAEGAAGNTFTTGGGKGGYSAGTVYLNKGDILYIYTGGKGSVSASASTTKSGGGYNGGGAAANYAGGGGGGTDIRLKPINGTQGTDYTTLYARLIVAGGGGGKCGYSTQVYCYGGTAGGETGTRGTYQASTTTNTTYAGQGATQIAGGATGTTSYAGTAGTFGTGGQGGVRGTSTSYYGSGGGGGGWYGGGGGAYRYGGGGGGSGWIYTATTYNTWKSGNATDANKYLLTSDYYLDNAVNKAGTATDIPTTDGTATETGHSGNGYAKITYCGATADGCN